MFEQADYAQPFSFNGIVRKLEVIRPAPGTNTGENRDFVLLEDVLDHFGISHLSGVYFERQDGLSLSFTRDKNLRRLVHVLCRQTDRRGSCINQSRNSIGLLSQRSLSLFL